MEENKDKVVEETKEVKTEKKPVKKTTKKVKVQREPGKRLSTPATVLITIAGTLLAICVIRLVYFLTTGI